MYMLTRSLVLKYGKDKAQGVNLERIGDPFLSPIITCQDPNAKSVSCLYEDSVHVTPRWMSIYQFHLANFKALSTKWVAEPYLQWTVLIRHLNIFLNYFTQMSLTVCLSSVWLTAKDRVPVAAPRADICTVYWRLRERLKVKSSRWQQMYSADDILTRIKYCIS